MIFWRTVKQNYVATSLLGAEFIAVATAANEIVWWNQILKDLNINLVKPIPIFEDNQMCINILVNEKFCARMNGS